MPQTKRQEKKMLTRQKIMDTAFRLFASDGFSTTTHTIAREAGLSHGALFVHFPTREALQLSVLERFTRELGGKLHDLSLQEGSLAELLHAHINILSAYESFYRHMICELSALPHETKTLLLSAQTVLAHHFRTALEKERLTAATKDIPPHMLFNIWVGLLHYYLQNSEMFAPTGFVLKRYQEDLTQSFIKLISNEEVLT